MNTKRIFYMILLVVLIACSSGNDSSNPLAPPSGTKGTFEFINGKWLDGNTFIDATFYSQNGFLTTTKLTEITETIDLKGKYVIPPFAEAHTHTLMNNLDRISEFLDAGIFYAKVMNVTKGERDRVISQFNKPSSVDVQATVGAITASNAHPVQIGLNWASSVAELDGDWVHIIESMEDLNQKWPSIIASNDDFIKTFLVYSDEYEKRYNDPIISMRHRGMNPALLPEIVRRAHTAGLKVSSHVRTATDFHNAITTGVDEIAHLPGFAISGVEEFSDPARFIISEEDARLAASEGVIVQTTIRGAADNEIIKMNLSRLREEGVSVIIGSDAGERNSIDEVFYLHDLNVYENLELLKMITENTSQAIFPERQIGRLREGYEASFLVLSGDPIQNFRNITEIELRVKQGQIILTK